MSYSVTPAIGPWPIDVHDFPLPQDRWEGSGNGASQLAKGIVTGLHRYWPS